MIHTTKPRSIDYAKKLHEHIVNSGSSEKLQLHDRKGAETLEALFLGTKGINSKYLTELLLVAVAGNVYARESLFPNDPDYVNKEIQESESFQDTMMLMRREFVVLVDELTKSGTFYSMRSIGHMLWDTAMPGILGYFAALLYNQNNVAVEASPVTTWLEMEVGNELCKMLGYKIKPIGLPPLLNNPIPASDETTNNSITAWGHITCDGSVANLEGLWMARNLKFYAVSTKAAILNEPALAAAKNFKVTLLDGTAKPLIQLDNWTLLNLPIDEVLTIPDEIESQTNSQITVAIFSQYVTNYLVQSIGYHDIMTKYLTDINSTPVSMGPATKHYSWPKGAAILGIGANNMWAVKVDEKARMCKKDLISKLDECLASKTPVLNVVAVLGTTEESAVDPLKDIIALREVYRAQGMEFAIHVDAAWGGYFNTMLTSSDDSDPSTFVTIPDKDKVALPMSKYVVSQYQSLSNADSITIDPHKAGYVPYPAGGLCYRNSAMRNLVSFTAPVVYHGGIDPTVGVYGVEGSKPGAAASAVYFSHRVIRPNVDGYGKMLGQCMFNAKRLYAAFSTWNIKPNLPFFFVPLIPIPAIQNGESSSDVQTQYQNILNNIVNVSNETLINDPKAFGLFKELGGDQTIITYMFNYYNLDGTPNTDTTKLNKLNEAIYTAFSFSPKKDKVEDTKLVVTSSSFTSSAYGTDFMNKLRTRLLVTDADPTPIDFLITTIMNPWLSNTIEGSFIPTIIDIMESTIIDIVNDIRKPKV
ncbi:MAG: decarboxylase [Saprospiraceae bacterium]|jgi:glutamate/tyrosine decarboxylase-like PLP-dependent enzyme|nr:decarboxylase [Saprospiraceae bacterium]